MKAKSLLATPWTAAYQAPPSMGFSRQEYWSGVPLPSPSLSHTCDKLHRTDYTHTSTNGETVVRSVICISVDILVVTVPYCFTRCHHSRLTGGGCAESTTSYNCI